MQSPDKLIYGGCAVKPVFLLGGWRFSGIVRIVLLLALGGASGTKLAAGTIWYDIQDLGANAYRYSYSLSSFDFRLGQELEIRFTVDLYGSLSNGVAGTDFDLLVMQPNSPPGSSGIYSALALADHASLEGPFQVDVVYLGTGRPGAQWYWVNEFDDNGEITVVEAGRTVLVGTIVPEPEAWLLAVTGALLCMLYAAVRRRVRPVAARPRAGVRTPAG
jgi:hypothetical protein